MVEMTYTEKAYFESRTKGVFSGSMAESIAGMGAVALAIIGLAHVYPLLLASIAIITIGVALAFAGGAVSARYSALNGDALTKTDAVAHWAGVIALFFAGASGIALGILSLVGVVPMILIPVAALAFGSALMLDSGANERLSALEARHAEAFEVSEKVVRKTAQASAGIQILVGMGSIVLGILALIGFAPLVLSLVVMLGIGGVELLTGAMIGGRTARVFSK